MKKIIAIMCGLALAGISGAAHAAQVTANAGLTFTSGGTCTVSGNIVNLGNFSALDAVSAYAAKFGQNNSDAAPTAPAVKLTTDNCTDKMAYSLVIQGDLANKAAKVVRNDAVPVDVFNVVPKLTHINGSAVTNQFINGDTTANTYSGTGTGANQDFQGYWNIFNPTAGQLQTLLTAGNYSANATAIVSF